MLTRSEQLRLENLTKYLENQIKSSKVYDLEDLIDENTGEVVHTGNKGVNVDENVSIDFNEAFQNSLKTNGIYLSCKLNNKTFNVIKFKNSEIVPSKFSDAEGNPKMWKKPARFILAQEATILEYQPIVENKTEEIRVQM